jgi:hypothetical protein
MDRSQLPINIMRQLKRRKKSRNYRFTLVWLLLLCMILGVSLSFTILATPMIQYFIPLNKADGSQESSSAPHYSLGSILESARIPDAAADIRVVSGRLVTQGTSSRIEGLVKNTGRRTYKGFTLYYDLYDPEGKYAGGAFAMIGEIKPGETKKFSTTPLNKIAATAELNTIIGA